MSLQRVGAVEAREERWWLRGGVREGAKERKDADGVHHHRAVIGGKQVKVMVGKGQWLL
jgi:hypothetical protein